MTSKYPAYPSKSYGYRYGFNGMEKDDGIGNTAGAVYDYGFRIYDSRIGKFTSVDPLSKSYPWYTPYQFAGNTPIVAIDLDGLEELWVHMIEQEDGSFIQQGDAVVVGEKTTVGLLNVIFDIPPEKLGQPGILYTYNPRDGSPARTLKFDGTVFEVVDYKPSESKSEGKSFLEKIHTSFIHSKGDATGPNAGVLEGEDGLLKTTSVMNEVGDALLLTPLAPAGVALNATAAVFESVLDFSKSTVSTEDAFRNTAVRAVGLVLTYGVGKAIPDKTVGKNIVNFTLEKSVDKVTEKIITLPKSEQK